MNNKFQQLYNLTKKFNDISGATKEVSEKAFLEQYSYIREEFNELTDSLGGEECYQKGLQNLEPFMLDCVLDDCLDIVITVFGMLQKLETLGVDVGEAAINTAMNNLSKYTPSPAIAHQSVEKLLIEKGIHAEAKFNEEHNCYVIRNRALGKVCKPMDFISNDLSVFITEEVQGNYGKGN